ncbi:MAG: response regulator transcription factor [Spirochaetota bacterium]|nr:response regulator transcription factor [Spirochaetota bacterium]
MKQNIFIIDDEKDILEIVSINIVKEGYNAFCFSSGEDALKAIEKETPDLIILDIMMNGMDGYEFCKHIRFSKDYKYIPIIFLSAKSEEFNKILGLELGGDDYVTKPFSIKELVSRVKAVLRRVGDNNSNPNTNSLRFKGIELFPDKFVLRVEGKNVSLTKTEFELLHLFLKYPQKIFTRDNIIDHIRGKDVYVVDRTIDVHVMNLRKKLGKYKNIISTFSGVGYGIKE